MSYDIIPSDRDELIYELKRLKSEYEVTIPYFKDISELQKKKEKIEKDLSVDDTSFSSCKDTALGLLGCGGMIYVFILGPALYFFGVFPQWFVNIIDYFGYWQFGFGLYIVLYVWMMIATFTVKKNNKKMLMTIQEDIDNKIEKVKNIIHHIPSDFIPDDYKSYLAIEGMLNRVEAHRADTFKEALNLYTAESIHLKKIFGLDGLTKEYICQQWIVIQAHEPNKYGEETKEKLY